MNPIDGLPHRPPFRFVTTVEAFEQHGHARGVWQVRGDEDFLRGHFPGNPLVPGVLIGEALAQLSGIVSNGADPRMPGAHLAHIDLKFTAPVAPPAHIVLTSRLVRTLGTLSFHEVNAQVQGLIVAKGSLVLSAVAPS